MERFSAKMRFRSDHELPNVSHNIFATKQVKVYSEHGLTAKIGEGDGRALFERFSTSESEVIRDCSSSNTKHNQ
jgi:hypothetical protein